MLYVLFKVAGLGNNSHGKGELANYNKARLMKSQASGTVPEIREPHQPLVLWTK